MRLGGVVDTSTIDWYGNVSLVSSSRDATSVALTAITRA